VLRVGAHCWASDNIKRSVRLAPCHMSNACIPSTWEQLEVMVRRFIWSTKTRADRTHTNSQQTVVSLQRREIFQSNGHRAQDGCAGVSFLGSWRWHQLLLHARCMLTVPHLGVGRWGVVRVHSIKVSQHGRKYRCLGRGNNKRKSTKAWEHTRHCQGPASSELAKMRPRLKTPRVG